MIITPRRSLIAMTAWTVLSCSETTAPTPLPPSDVSAQLLSPTSVQLSWSPRPAAEKVARYFVYRNGLRVGETATTTFTESGLAENVTVGYSITSVIESGYETDQSDPVQITTRDATPPRIVQNFPLNGDGPLFVENITIMLVFSEAMDSATINSSTFTLKVGPTGEPIPGVIRYFKRDQVADFHSNRTMPPATTIVVTAEGMKDAAGNPLAEPYTFSFTTTENVRPFIAVTFPANEATEVPLDTEVRITFSEPMKVASLTTRIFDLSSNLPADHVPVTSTWDAATNTQILRGRYKSKHHYEVVVGPSFPAEDLAGNRLQPPNRFFFTTLDAGPPVAVAKSPGDGAVDVDPAAAVLITFNEALDPASITASNFGVYRSDGSGEVAGTISYDASTFTAIFRPANTLAPATQYGVFLTEVRDATGVVQEERINYLFTTR